MRKSQIITSNPNVIMKRAPHSLKTSVFMSLSVKIMQPTWVPITNNIATIGAMMHLILALFNLLEIEFIKQLADIYTILIIAIHIPKFP
jgi:hypothetical protein